MKLSIPGEARVVLFSGALNKRKGIMELVSAVQMNSYRVPVFLLVCGPDYGYKDQLLRDIRALNGGNLQVRYEGLVSNINEYLTAADIFVLPSYAEGLSNALLEAAMSGLGLIATDIGGNRDIIEPGENGCLFAPGDTIQLAALIDQLVHDQVKTERFGKEARQKANREYSLSQVAGRYVRLYREMMKR